MAMRLSTATLLAGAVTASVLAPAGAAHAGAENVVDQTSDVWESETNDGEYVASEQQDNVDVASMQVRHLKNRIVVTATYVELKKSGVPLVLSNRLRFDDGPAVTIMVDTSFKEAGESVLYNRRGSLDCDNFAHSVDHVANTVELSVPRSCVGGPRWVEANYVSLGYVEDPAAESGYRSYRDNALDGGASMGGWTERVRRG